ncbi:hypothetical protein CEXT_345881 [Caerostris extrusa]|uniref:Uncharacterized protein n=1 Tax=Caerostris extrusa TaxID=172846 RepID=A0AAV4T9Y8_CAEEX|nr:hypothetical protein CEXT_345881 [Caerostris extrusa]
MGLDLAKRTKTLPDDKGLCCARNITRALGRKSVGLLRLYQDRDCDKGSGLDCFDWWTSEIQLLAPLPLAVLCRIIVA